MRLCVLAAVLSVACMPAFAATTYVKAGRLLDNEAIDAINRLETYRRGPYSGCVLIADSDGFLDAALVLRALYRQGDQTWLQAGAGIVAQSTPERELQETIEKFRSISQYLVVAQ